MEITGAAEVLVFITAIVGLAVISLQKQPGAAEGVRLRESYIIPFFWPNWIS
jgi:hypothetical protein